MAVAVRRIGSLAASTRATRASKTSNSIASARSAASAIARSSSESSVVENRSALAIDWRWWKVSFKGGANNGSARRAEASR